MAGEFVAGEFTGRERPLVAGGRARSSRRGIAFGLQAFEDARRHAQVRRTCRVDLRDKGAQFAHIAGPGVDQEEFDEPYPARQLDARGVFDSPAPAIARGVLFKHGAQQQAQIFAALDQGR